MYAENCLKNKDIGESPYNTLNILARYYYHIFGFRKKRIITNLLRFLSESYPRYELDELSWRATVDRIASAAGKHKLLESSGVKITKSEMQTIKELNNRVLERLAFTMLCLAKLWDQRNPKNNGWVNEDSKTIFESARIVCSSEEREVKIGTLWNLGLLEFARRNDNLNCRVTFIDDDDAEELFVSDFRELGYEYLLYRGEKFIRCAECGILTRNNSASTRKYCRNCGSYSPAPTRKVFCIDCGSEFERPSTSRRIRCDECYAEERRRIEREKKQKRRKR